MQMSAPETAAAFDPAFAAVGAAMVTMGAQGRAIALRLQADTAEPGEGRTLRRLVTRMREALRMRAVWAHGRGIALDDRAALDDLAAMLAGLTPLLQAAGARLQAGRAEPDDLDVIMRISRLNCACLALVHRLQRPRQQRDADPAGIAPPEPQGAAACSATGPATGAAPHRPAWDDAASNPPAPVGGAEACSAMGAEDSIAMFSADEVDALRDIFISAGMPPPDLGHLLATDGAPLAGMQDPRLTPGPSQQARQGDRVQVTGRLNRRQRRRHRALHQTGPP